MHRYEAWLRGIGDVLSPLLLRTPPTLGSTRPGDLLEPAIPKLRRERGPFVCDDDLLLAAFYSRSEFDALKAAGPIAT